MWPVGRVGVHLSPNGNFNDMGSPDFRETFLYAARPLNNYELGYLHLVETASPSAFTNWALP